MAARPDIDAYVLLLALVGPLDMALKSACSVTPDAAANAADQVIHFFINGIQERPEAYVRFVHPGHDRTDEVGRSPYGRSFPAAAETFADPTQSDG